MHKYKEIFPGTFTMLNAVCGFISLLLTLEGDIVSACWFIVLAGFLDALDGRVARLSGVSSRFGVELDSLADFLSFGVAPAFLMYSLKLPVLGKLGWIVVSSIYIMAAGYRLAKFNLYAETEEKKEFVGLPVPGAAIAMVTFIILCLDLWGQVQYPELVVSMIILFSFLMVSQVQYDTLPEDYSTRYGQIKVVAILIAGIAVLVKPRLVLFPVFGLYILYGMIRELYRLFAKGVTKVAERVSQKEEI
jgi:CDP-diacylglycerol--serine O-phosphatidyltransferase